MNAPCYRCEYRKPGCHGVCEAYQHYNALNEQRREERYQGQAPSRLERARRISRRANQKWRDKKKEAER